MRFLFTNKELEDIIVKYPDASQYSQNCCYIYQKSHIAFSNTVFISFKHMKDISLGWTRKILTNSKMLSSVKVKITEKENVLDGENTYIPCMS